MGTRSAIGVKDINGSIRAVYCHWDGYLKHNGRILLENYTTMDLANELLDYGDMSSLREKIHPNVNSEHSFENPQEGVCIFYHRDREEDWEDVSATTFEKDSDFLKYYDDSEYFYLFVDGTWYYIDTWDWGYVQGEDVNWKKLTLEDCM